MRRLYLHIVLFSIPIVIPLLIILLSGLYIGEIIPRPLIIQWQQSTKEEVIVFLPYWQQSEYADYKARGAININPDILVLGSSRTVYFTDNFLDNGTLYNASIIGSNIAYQHHMLDYLIEHNIIPDIVLLGIDLPSYNAQIQPDFIPQIQDLGILDTREYMTSSFRSTLSQWLSWQMPTLLRQSGETNGVAWVGSRATIDRAGLLADGSQLIPFPRENYLTANFNGGRRTYASRENRYTVGTDVNQESFHELSELLILANNNNITVIGFTQPYHPEFFALIQDNPDFAYRDEALAQITDLFDDFDFPFFTFPNIESYNGSPDNFRDDWHYNQLASLRIFTIIAEQTPNLLGIYVNLERLYHDIETAQNPFNLYYTQNEPPD